MGTVGQAAQPAKQPDWQTRPIKTISTIKGKSFKQKQAKQVIKPKVKATASGNTDVKQSITKWAKHYGVDPNHLLRIAKCESRLNPKAVNRNYYENGNPSGLFQHLSGYWPARAAQYGRKGASVFDADAQAQVTAAMFAAGQSNLWECK